MRFPMFSFSIHDLMREAACFLPMRHRDMEKHLNRPVLPSEQIPASVWWKLPSTADQDIIWSLRLDQENGHLALVALGIEVADKMLRYFERFHPENKEPRAALEAAQAWLDNPNRETAITAWVKANQTMSVSREIYKEYNQCAGFAALQAVQLVATATDRNKAPGCILAVTALESMWFDQSLDRDRIHTYYESTDGGSFGETNEPLHSLGNGDGNIGGSSEGVGSSGKVNPH